MVLAAAGCGASPGSAGDLKYGSNRAYEQDEACDLEICQPLAFT